MRLKTGGSVVAVYTLQKKGREPQGSLPFFLSGTVVTDALLVVAILGALAFANTPTAVMVRLLGVLLAVFWVIVPRPRLGPLFAVT